MPRPNFMFVGPMKAGTTWIYNYLESRGDVCLPKKVKETFYFERNYHRGNDWYDRFFQHFDANEHKWIIEVAPSLFHFSSSAAKKMHNGLGDIPLVVTLRDPVLRAWSHYRHMCRYGYTNEPLQKAVKKFPAIVDASCYAARLDEWSAHFSKIDVIWQEDLAQDSGAFARRLCTIMELPYKAVGVEIDRPINQAASPRSFHLARAGRIASHKMRSWGLYGVVNAAKKTGLKPLFFGSGKTPNAPSLKASEADLTFLTEHFAADQARLYKRYNSAKELQK